MARVFLAKARCHEGNPNNAIVPPLGLMYLASVLREEGHEVRIFDIGREWRDLRRFRQAVRDFRPDVVGLSAITFECNVMESMADACRSELPAVPIMVGGPHPTAYPERCAHHPAIDFVVLGEGERTCTELVRLLDRGGDPSAVHGLAFVAPDGQFVMTPERETIEDVDSIPFPAWDLVDVELYANEPRFSHMGRGRNMLLFTSRGCPFKCIYCHEVQGKRFRARSPQNVLAEMEVLRDRFGINEFEIVDDIFNFDRDRMIEILDRVRVLNPRPVLHFPNALRTDILDAKQISALRRSGTTSLSIAVETATPRLQKLSKKYLKIEKVRENIDIAVREGLFVRGFFMLGFPTETFEEARASVDFALASPLHQAFFFIVTPFAGTALYELYQDILKERGISLDGTDGSYEAGAYNLSAMKDSELFGLQREAFVRFYGSPRRIVRILERYPRWTELARTYSRSFLRMLTIRRLASVPERPVLPVAVETPRRRMMTAPTPLRRSLRVMNAP